MRLYLLFSLGRDRYALDVRDVAEVLPLCPLKQVPEAPAWVAGVHAHRGELIPVLDLNQLCFGQPVQRRTSTRLVLVDYRSAGSGPRQRLGLLLEQTTQTRRLDPAAFRDYGLQQGDAAYLGPVLEEHDGLLQLIRVDDLLPDSVRALLSSAAEEGTA
ncbi:chemotaxis protein CheW [Pseudomonas schmalbachii]|nr:chemotaxis protein CheW [Pseudomonas schmalbachii]